MGDQFDSCGTQVRQFCISLEAPESRHCPSEVWICPGDTATLYWTVTNDVTSAEIDHDIGSVDVPSGSISVSPETDTTYKLTAHSDCDTASDTVNVWVTNPGDKRSLSAHPDYSRGIWYIDVDPRTTSPDIIITSITPISCGPGYAAWPEWACEKTDLDGRVWNFNILGRTSPGDVPLVGSWVFAPLDSGEYLPQSNACFEVTLRCE
jgi:hypothetical protein